MLENSDLASSCVYQGNWESGVSFLESFSLKVMKVAETSIHRDSTRSIQRYFVCTGNIFFASSMLVVPLLLKKSAPNLQVNGWHKSRGNFCFWKEGIMVVMTTRVWSFLSALRVANRRCTSFYSFRKEFCTFPQRENSFSPL